MSTKNSKYLYFNIYTFIGGIKTKKLAHLQLIAILLVTLILTLPVAQASENIISPLGAGSGSEDIGNTGKLPWFHYINSKVNSANGNLYLSQKDISLSSVGLDILEDEVIEFKESAKEIRNLEVIRSYNSQNNDSDSPFGFGWTHNYNIFLEGDGSDKILHDKDGAKHIFTKDGGVFNAPPGIQLRLKEVGNAFELRRKDGTILNFDSAGKLTNIIDKNSNQLDLTYTGDKLTAVEGFGGLTIDFQYTGDRISKITYPVGREINYAYDGDDNLEEVQDSMGNSALYFYDPDHNLLNYVNREEVSTDFIYTDEKVTEMSLSLYDSNTETFHSKLRMNSIFYGPNNVVVIGPRGGQSIIQLNENGNPSNIIDALGGNTRMSWDDDMNLLSFTDANEHMYTYEYDDYGNIVSKTDALGEIITYVWDNTDSDTQYISLLDTVTMLIFLMIVLGIS